MKHLHAYQINGSTVGVELDTWETSDLGGNAAFVVSDNSMEPGYANISSILNWDKFGTEVGYRHCRIREQIEALYNMTDWDALTMDEKKVVSKYFLVDKNKRDEVLSQSEQDEYNHFKLYHFLSDDILLSLGEVDQKVTPKSIDYKISLNRKLHPKYTFDKFGFLVEVTYYSKINFVDGPFGPTPVYSDPVLKYEAEYFMDDLYYVTHRRVTRRWYLMDDTLSDDSKVTMKYYSRMQAREEGSVRRKNLINNLVLEVVALIMMTSEDINTVDEAEADGMPFMTSLSSALSQYYESGAKKDSEGNPCLLVQEITNSTYSRLDNYISVSPLMTLRQYILMKIQPE